MKLRDYMTQTDLSIGELSEMTGLSHSTLSLLVRDKRRPSMAVVDLIAETTEGHVMGNDWMRWAPSGRAASSLPATQTARSA